MSSVAIAVICRIYLTSLPFTFKGSNPLFQFVNPCQESIPIFFRRETRFPLGSLGSFDIPRFSPTSGTLFKNITTRGIEVVIANLTQGIVRVRSSTVPPRSSSTTNSGDHQSTIFSDFKAAGFAGVFKRFTNQRHVLVIVR